MTKKMKILIISAEVWRDDSNGGNVLSNIFQNFDAEFAQIYCNPGNPSNVLCKNYYQMTDKMVIDNILKKKVMGEKLVYDNFPQDTFNTEIAQVNHIKGYKFLKKLRFESFLVAKEILWSLSNWRNDRIKEFILDFNPDIIFAPCYGSHFMLSLTRYVSKLTKKPIISYISDDHYSLKQFRFSPIFWMNRFILRKNLRKTFKYYDLTYTMTQEQLEECKKAFNCNIKILKKGGDFSNLPIKNKINIPIRIVYAGGIYCGRIKTLIKLVQVIKKLNKKEQKFVLDIYTGNSLSKKQSKILNDGQNSRVHGIVTQEELKNIYSNADIALHVESFDWKNRLLTRISFSTKIVDLLASSCTVMAISWKKHSGYTYLKRENAAICIDNISKLEETLLYLSENPNELKECAQRAISCGMRNHRIDEVQQTLKKDFSCLFKEGL